MRQNSKGRNRLRDRLNAVQRNGPLTLWGDGKPQEDKLVHFMMVGCMVDQEFPPMDDLEEALAYAEAFNRGYVRAYDNIARGIENVRDSLIGS